jgi:hypothetical protein
VATKDEILAQIKALQDEANSMGEGEEYEIEIWNPDGAGTRLPAKQSEPWLRKNFPDLFAPDEEESGEEEEGKPDPKGKPGKPAAKTPPGTRTGAATKYFGKRPAGK